MTKKAVCHSINHLYEAELDTSKLSPVAFIQSDPRWSLIAGLFPASRVAVHIGSGEAVDELWPCSTDLPHFSLEELIPL
jgi:hypothetical protein